MIQSAGNEFSPDRRRLGPRQGAQYGQQLACVVSFLGLVLLTMRREVALDCPPAGAQRQTLLCQDALQKYQDTLHIWVLLLRLDFSTH